MAGTVRVTLEAIEETGTFDGTIRKFAEKAKRGPVGLDCTWICDRDPSYTIRGYWDGAYCNGVITYPRGWDKEKFDGLIYGGRPLYGKLFFANGDIFDGELIQWPGKILKPCVNHSDDKDPVYSCADGKVTFTVTLPAKK